MLISFLFLFLLSNESFLRNQNDDPSTICPEPEIIAPCVCTKACPVCQAMVECSGIINIDQLKEVFEKTPDWSFWNLIISNSTFQYLPADTITIKKVRKLHLRNNIMYALFDKEPPSTNVLNELELTNLILQNGIQWEVFSSLKHLNELSVTNFTIPKIDQSFVNNFPVGLTGLFFTDTKTKKLGETAFAKLEDLTRLFILETEISSLQRSMFPPVSKLIAMHFSHNKISSLPDDIFTNMPDLAGINFSSTNITTLTGPVFENIIPQLQLLWFEDNDIDCGCAMKWVPKYKTLPKYLKVTCTSPASVAGLSMAELKDSHFWHCE